MINETKRLKDYLTYIRSRLAYLKMRKVPSTNNEYRFHLEMYKNIKAYGKSHKIFFLYLTSKINITKYKTFYNVSERTGYRILAEQRKEFINFIIRKETELFKRYPFETDF
jgi:hypothetical protein